ncbi:MAG: YdcF family protein [Alicyclobacillus sp.]|nr:YdcF family protein [Alicyclobacillus sp.]
MCIAAAALTGALLVLVAARRLRYLGRRTRPAAADAAIILGAYTDGYRPSRTLAARLKAGLELYRNGLVPYLIVCGGRGRDETVSESSSMKRFLVLNGVPANVIIEDHTSVDTWENLTNGKALMEKWQLRTGIVVTSDYHLPRAMAVAGQLGLNVTGYAAVSASNEYQYAIREVFAIIIYLLTGRISVNKGPDSLAALCRRLFW